MEAEQQKRVPRRTPPATRPAEAAPEWLRGVCPRCGAGLVSNCYYVSGRGYLVLWECEAARGDADDVPPGGAGAFGCDYRRVL